MLGPSKTCHVPVCIPLCLSQPRGVGWWEFWWHWSMLWPAPFSVWFELVGGLAWTTWSQWVCPWYFRVWLALPRSALCPALADLSVPWLWCLVHSQWPWAPHFDTVGRGGIGQYPLQPWSLGMTDLSFTSVLLFPHMHVYNTGKQKWDIDIQK